MNNAVCGLEDRGLGAARMRAGVLRLTVLWQEAKTAASALSQPEIPRCQQLLEILTIPKFAPNTNKNADRAC